MTKIDIFGSCVSRDVFNFCHESSLKDGTYITRTSLFSLFYTPLAYNDVNIDLSSNFLKRLVENDMFKTTFSKLKLSDSSYILVDFVDSVRFRLAKIGSTYVTYSSEFEKGTNSKKFPLFTINSDNSFDDKDLSFFIMKFCTELKKIYAENRIILHRVRWCDHCRKTKTGEIVDFSVPTIKENKIYNHRIMCFEDCFLKYCSQSKILDLNNQNFVADEKHVWGLLPIHYENGYYETAARELENLISE
jgi:hypothetical protein